MVSDVDNSFYYTIARDEELDALLLGGEAGVTVAWESRARTRLKEGQTGVVWSRNSVHGPLRPWVLVSTAQGITRLCARYAQLRSDLSPLTAWSFLLTPDVFESLSSLEVTPDLGNLEAAWIGLVVAESRLLAEQNLREIRISACLATQTFAIARTRALWNRVPVGEILFRFDTSHDICRGSAPPTRWESASARVRTRLEPVWRCLLAAASGPTNVLPGEYAALVDAIRLLQSARENGASEEARHFFEPLRFYVPEGVDLDRLAELPAENRLRLFDEVVHALAAGRGASQGDSVRHNALAMVAGYLATVAAGGSPSLSLADGVAAPFPEITAWAYLLGGVGEKIIWSSGFDGLGRLVGRELTRPLRLDEPPTSDFGFDEGAVLVDPQLSDPLVHLRLKQSRTATVALWPGVNVTVPLGGEPQRQASSRVSPTKTSRQSSENRPGSMPGDLLAALADALWPYIRNRFEAAVGLEDRHGTRRGSGPQAKLPFNPKR